MHSPSVTIKLRKETIEAILANSDERITLISQDIHSQEDKIIELLRNYEGEKDHMGQVFSYEQDSVDESVDIDSIGNGGMSIEFTVNVYSGCRDIDANFDDEIHVAIEINFEEGTALLIGQDLVPEREPDDY